MGTTDAEQFWSVLCRRDEQLARIETKPVDAVSLATELRTTSDAVRSLQTELQTKADAIYDLLLAMDTTTEVKADQQPEAIEGWVDATDSDSEAQMQPLPDKVDNFLAERKAFFKRVTEMLTQLSA